MKKYASISIALILSLSGCDSHSDRIPAPKNVKVAEITSGSAQEILTFPGKAVATNTMNLGFRVSGMVRRTFVSDGETVATGKLLAELDPTDYQIQLEATEAKYNQVKSEAQRVMAMHGDGAVADNDYDKAVFGLQQVEGMLNNHRNQLAYTKLYAPCSGKIKEVMVKSGEVIGAGMPALTMIDNGVPQIEINIPAPLLDRIPYCTATCSFMAIPGVTYDLSMISVSPTANANQLYTVKYAVSNTASAYPKPGMNTTVTLADGTTGSTVFGLPVSAIVARGDDTFVFKIHPHDSIVTLVPVVAEKLTRDGFVGVRSDSLSDGDMVVASGTRHLNQGDKVAPMEKPSKSNKGGLM